ncbi:MAG: hypothetical protein JNK49_21250, partial [Planctomycetes bacterium]|nr:hypothetical protein [Planctomycetota bacterium]
PPGRNFVLLWAADPLDLMSRTLPHVLEARHTGVVVLPTTDPKVPARGFVSAGAGSVHGLDAVHVAGPGLTCVNITVLGNAPTGTALPGCRDLARLRIAVVGAELASHVALELVHSGATRLNLLDDGGRVELHTLGLLADIEPECIGEFRAYAVATRLRSRWQVDVEPQAGDAQGIASALDRINPDVVIVCESDMSRRAVVSLWCGDRLRMLVEVVPDSPWLRRLGDAGAIVRARMPGTAVASRAGCAAARTPDVLDNPPLPVPGSRIASLGRHDLALRLALFQRAARAAATSLNAIVRGQMPPNLRIRVTQRVDGRVVGSATEVVACDEVVASTRAGTPECVAVAP